MIRKGQNSKTNKKLDLAKKTEIKFGEDLNKEQEKLLVDHFDQTPVFVTNYPKSMKPFYMRQNDSNPTLVDNFDLLAPFVGEIVGGSAREYRPDILVQSMQSQNLDLNLYQDYLKSKQFGGMKMGGFGIYSIYANFNGVDRDSGIRTQNFILIVEKSFEKAFFYKYSSF
jgi:asparaginyl-tRNA synthetase